MSNQLRWKTFAAALASVLAVGSATPDLVTAATTSFHVEEATIGQIQAAILAKQITTKGVVEAYLKRIKAYNGTCVKQPEGLLGPIQTIPHAGQINALSTLNLRPATRKAWGFDERKARSMTDEVDNDSKMPDALEVAAQEDAFFAKTGKLIGPLHGVVIAVKDQYDTLDLRTTSGADAFYANDRPPTDSTFVQRLRAAGAIILAKSNMGEYAAGARSSFGGTFCNPYDTERSPGGSSGGSGSSVGANLVTCAIGEESGPSIRSPSKNNNIVGIAPTEELVSRNGMIAASFMNDRVGPMCRTVGDAARVLDVIAGYDPKDELTAFSIDRMPPNPYRSYAAVSDSAKPLQGVRIGVVREYMDKTLFTQADIESIDIIDREIGALAKLGATIVDPGAGGALFQNCLEKYDPQVHNSAFIKQFPQLFPVDDKGKPTADQVPQLVDLFFDSSKFPTSPDAPSIRGLGPAPTIGERRYMMERYLRARGDANIKTVEDLIQKANFYVSHGDDGFMDKKKTLEDTNKEQTLDIANRLQTRWALQQIGLQCMAQIGVDVLTYPTGNIPAPKLGAPSEPTIHGRASNAWTLLGQQGFPAITVPAGFTTEVYDRVADPAAPKSPKLVGPVAARLPVGIDFMGRPFNEPLLLKVAAAYEGATRHREPPPGFGAP
jgi:amidase